MIAAAVIAETMGRAITQVAGATTAGAAAIRIADLLIMPGRGREALTEMEVATVATVRCWIILRR